MAGVWFDLLAQAANVDVNRSWRNERSFLPYRVEQLIARQHAAAMRRKIFQQAKLSHRGEHVAALHLYSHRRDIDFQLAEPQDFTRDRSLAQPAQHAPDARDQFARAERFCDVVIAAELQALDAVGLGGFRRKKDDGSR